MRIEKIGAATLYLGDCREIMPTLGTVNAVITDPPYSGRLHTHFEHGVSVPNRDGAAREGLGYASLSLEDVCALAQAFNAISLGWVVWMTDSDLAKAVRDEMESLGRTSFPPLPFFHPGRSVRLSGDGPSSWTDWIVVARTKAQSKWGTLPGGYVAGPGWNDKERMGGKPTLLMDNLVRDYSRPGDIVLDTHMGSGTTGVSCVKAGRSFIGCEIEEAAFEVACERIYQAQRQGSIFG